MNKYQRGFLLIIALVLYIGCAFVMHQQQGVIDSYSALVDKQREDMESANAEWYSAYHELSMKNYLLEQEVKDLKKSGAVQLPYYSYDLSEVILLAKCVQCEAGEGNDLSQKYITKVILNRVTSSEFPNTITEVIYQKTPTVQFNVAYNGSLNSCELKNSTLVNVYQVLMFDSALPEYVEYFYSESLVGRDVWITRLPVYATIEGTVFAYSSSR